MPKGPIRRAQLIAPFGVGALVVAKDGTSLISAGIDHWYKHEEGTPIDENEYIFEEWRLQRLLGVDYFCLPPDYRYKRYSSDAPNLELTVPFLRFPTWHFCPGCYMLKEFSLSARTAEKCPDCRRKGQTKYFVQVPFIAMCDHGHLQDFPWREWVHNTSEPACNKPIRLISTGGATLSAQKIVCDCGAQRSLGGITGADANGEKTYLSSNLETGKPFLCQGKRPWLGKKEESMPCDRPLRGTLRSASNIYYADVRSAIYLPRQNTTCPPELIERFRKPPLSTLVKLLHGTGHAIKPKDLRDQQYMILRDYTDEQIQSAVDDAIAGKYAGPEPGSNNAESSNEIRLDEYTALRETRQEKELLIKQAGMASYGPEITDYFSRIMLVKKLRETRVLAGFTRVFPENDLGLTSRKALLSREQKVWLPAYNVYGEGIFIEFIEDKLKEWENREEVNRRVKALRDNYDRFQMARHLHRKVISARFVLLHTFSHLLMNQLTFECGYSSAALRERLYASNYDKHPMSGVLIYTAAGDAEGTMGGLVRMGKEGYLAPVVNKALENAKWCSADPVCMELGDRGGQGPDSCNLAACHNCSLVPETACEEFNRFLDRALVIKDGLGYFC